MEYKSTHGFAENEKTNSYVSDMTSLHAAHGDHSQTNSFDAGNPVDEEKKSKKGTRRSVACKNCHSLKVKCSPSDPSNPSSPCVRCVNSKRTCEINLNQPRKRRKKAEILAARRLELQEGKRSISNSTDYSKNSDDGNSPGFVDHLTDPYDAHDTAQNLIQTSDDLQEQINQLKAEVEYYKSRSIFSDTDFVEKKDLEDELKILLNENGPAFIKLSDFLIDAAEKRTQLLFGGGLEPKFDLLSKGEPKFDLLSKGLMTVEEAQNRLDLYQNKIYSVFPYIDVDPTLNALELSRQSPFLFNSVMALTNILWVTNDLDHNQKIEIEATREIVSLIMIDGHKSEELLKCLLLLGFWYNTPEMVKSRRYHYFNSLAVSMLHDLGFASRFYEEKDPNKDDKNFANLTEQQRKLIILLYSSTVVKCLILRRSVFVKWTPYVEDCCVYFEKSDDKRLQELSVFSRLNQILERIHTVVHSSEGNYRETSSVSFVVSELEKKLLTVKEKISTNKNHLWGFYYAVEAFLYEPLLSQATGVNEEGQIYFKETVLSLISKSTEACMNCLTAFASLSTDEIAVSPLLYSVRIIYSAGILLRLRYFILSVPIRIEKSLVPVKAITIVETCLNNVIQTTKTYPGSFHMLKTSLMLQLFIYVYSMQVQTVVNHGGLECFDSWKLIAELNAEFQKFISNKGRVLGGSESRQNVLPLDVLSYAASLKRDLSGVSEISSKLKKSKSASNSPSNGTNRSTPQNASESKLRNLFCSVNDFVKPNVNGNGNQSNFKILDQFSSDPQMQAPYAPLTDGQIMNQGIAGIPNVVPRNNNNNSQLQPMSDQLGQDQSGQLNLAGAGELEKSLNNFGDEFWVDLLNPNANTFNFDAKFPVNSDVFL